MLPRLLCIFLIFSFFSISVLEVGEIDLSNHGNNISKAENSNSDIHCDDCKDEGCSDSNDCCDGICACTLSFFIQSKISSISINHQVLLNIEWYFYTNYRSPLIDPALKPPLYS